MAPGGSLPEMAKNGSVDRYIRSGIKVYICEMECILVAFFNFNTHLKHLN